MKPIIGIVAKPNFKSMRKGNMQFGIVNDWRQAILKAGGIPIGILPTRFSNDERINLEGTGANFHEESDEFLEDLFRELRLCSGVVFTGGLSFQNYEIEAARFCIENDIPIIGSCAGFNVIVMAMGGKVRRGTLRERKIHSRSKRELYAHGVEIIDNTKLAKIFSSKQINVNSRHWMMADVSGIPKGLIVSAKSEDGLVEAVEMPDRKFVVGVKWHPESMIRYDAGMRKL
ncbi:MAG: gamma-glutamyl-gamma-aminobutyrate hydrolase family protein, partial [Candidatus Nomurabacteria bacterium]|nr:gamma-glutamyl-gamma-aminobutyrate hydrolase family protein [Candidatus Nomurabacteria bacterium]